VPSGKSETPRVPASVPGHRLRREALRIFAEKLEGTTLSPTGADNLLAKHGTIAEGLRAVRSHSARRRQSGRFTGEGVFGAEIGMLRQRWIAGATAAFQLCLAALFLDRIIPALGVTAAVQRLEVVLYIVAASFALLALACWWRAEREIATPRPWW
jgi:hypothetical protein